jgi:hypothetical protein
VYRVLCASGEGGGGGGSGGESGGGGGGGGGGGRSSRSVRELTIVMALTMPLTAPNTNRSQRTFRWRKRTILQQL